MSKTGQRLDVSNGPPWPSWSSQRTCAEGLDEICRAINDVRFADKKRRLRQNWSQILSRGRQATPSPTGGNSPRCQRAGRTYQ